MIVMCQKARGVLRVRGFDWCSVRVSESQRSGRGLILDQMGSQQSDRDLNNLTCPPILAGANT